MRVLHVLPALTAGGAERVAVDLANQFTHDGHDVAMLLAYTVDPSPLSQSLDPRVEIRFVGGCKARFGAYFLLRRWLRANRAWVAGFDIVHAHLTFGSVTASFIRNCSKEAGPAVVETNHSVGMAIASWRRALQAILLEDRDAVALMASDPYWQMWRSANRPAIIDIIPNGVFPRPAPSAAQIEAYRREVAIPPDALLIGSVGRLLHERRPDALLEAFAAAAAELPGNVHLVLGGEGPERAALRTRAAELGLGDRVHLPGLVHKPGELLASLDLYLTVNVGGTTGIAAIEAAMSGLSVVAFQMDPAYRAAAGDWIWSSNNIAGLGARIAGLINDKAERDATAKRQSRHARAHHSADTMAKAYLAFYKSALRGRERTIDADQR